MATHEEIEAARARVDQLRAELEDRARKQAEAEAEAANEITLKNLEAEEAKLKAQLAEQDATIERSGPKGAQSPLVAAQADLDRAVQLQKATAVQLTGSDEAPAPPAPAAPAPSKTNQTKGK